jgi:hypothetical protein
MEHRPRGSAWLTGVLHHQIYSPAVKLAIAREQCFQRFANAAPGGFERSRQRQCGSNVDGGRGYAGIEIVIVADAGEVGDQGVQLLGRHAESRHARVQFHAGRIQAIGDRPPQLLRGVSNAPAARERRHSDRGEAHPVQRRNVDAALAATFAPDAVAVRAGEQSAGHGHAIRADARRSLAGSTAIDFASALLSGR